MVTHREGIWEVLQHFGHRPHKEYCSTHYLWYDHDAEKLTIWDDQVAKAELEQSSAVPSRKGADFCQKLGPKLGQTKKMVHFFSFWVPQNMAFASFFFFFFFFFRSFLCKLHCQDGQRFGFNPFSGIWTIGFERNTWSLCCGWLVPYPSFFCSIGIVGYDLMILHELIRSLCLLSAIKNIVFCKLRWSCWNTTCCNLVAPRCFFPLRQVSLANSWGA